MAIARGAGGSSNEDADSLEATGTQPGEVTHRVTVTAAFDLKGRP
jgi:hypothetical protein